MDIANIYSSKLDWYIVLTCYLAWKIKEATAEADHDTISVSHKPTDTLNSWPADGEISPDPWTAPSLQIFPPPWKLCFHQYLCWLVGLWAGLHTNYWKDFYETWMEGGSQPRIDPVIPDPVGVNYG